MLKKYQYFIMWIIKIVYKKKLYLNLQYANNMT